MSTTSSKSYLLDEPEIRETEIQRLHLQASALFNLEVAELGKHGIVSAKSILELGCGTGIFLSLLQNQFKAPKIRGIDRNQDLLLVAKEKLPQAELIKLDLSEHQMLTKIIEKSEPDLIVLRFVLQHLRAEEIESLLMSIARTRRKKGKVIIIDPDDTQLKFSPTSPSILKLVQKKISKQAERGGDRTIGSKLASLMKTAGFKNIVETVLLLGPHSVGLENFKAIFLPILESGISKTETIDEKKLVTEARNWFSEPEGTTSNWMHYPIYYVSGE